MGRRGRAGGEKSVQSTQRRHTSDASASNCFGEQPARTTQSSGVTGIEENVQIHQFGMKVSCEHAESNRDIQHTTCSICVASQLLSALCQRYTLHLATVTSDNRQNLACIPYPSQQNEPAVRLSKLGFSTFSDNYLEFSTFWQVFDIFVLSQNISDSSKISFLSSCTSV